MKKIITICFLFTVLVYQSYAAGRDYIPSDAKAVFSANLGQMISRTDMSVQELLNYLFLDKLSENFSINRDNDFVTRAIVNDATSIFDFDEYVRIIAFNNYDIVALLEIEDIIELNYLVLKIAREEIASVKTVGGGKFNYLSLDDDLLLAWDNNIFAIIVPLKGDSSSIRATAQSIFSRDSMLEDTVFVELEKNKSDISLWVDNDPETSNMSSINLVSNIFIGSGYDLGEWGTEYKDSRLIFEINFKNSVVDLEINSFMPNTSTDSSKLYKPIKKNIYSFIPNDVTGFMSLSFNPKVLYNILYEHFNDTESLTEGLEYFNSSLFPSGEMSILDIIENNISGDIIISVWQNTSEDSVEPYTFAIGLGINNKKDILDILEILEITEIDQSEYNFSEPINAPVYDVSTGNGEFFALIENKTMYIGTYGALNYISDLNKPALTDTKKIDLMSKNLMSIYVDLSVEIDDLSDITVVYNPVSKTRDKAIITLETINEDSFKSLFYLLKSLF